MLNAKEGILRVVDMKNVMFNLEGFNFDEKVDYEIEFAGALGLDIREVEKRDGEVDLAFYKKGNEIETEVGFTIEIEDNTVIKIKNIYSEVFEDLDGYDLEVVNEKLNDRLFN
ncbi:hypothetical protein GLW05_20945 [Pontibacillus yanchengensis]|uniref:Uncharacterized protein n=1 Tax=Pontibacillus yanchengensis TaxID=462910 RepID=A0A6I5A7C2_9BACI|nr:hypothetical protein [Pontibacillus yanchengensis]MYL36042.1 hypothetical protein [Pontibacillus yanchengensis]